MEPTEQYIQKRKTIEDMAQDAEVLAQVLSIRDAIMKQGIEHFGGDALSRAASKLAVYLVNIGQMAADAALKSNYAYAYRKFRFATDYKGMRKILNSVKDAEMTAQEATQKEVIEEIEAQYEADVLKSFYQDIERLITVIQTRLRVLENERARTAAHQS